MFNNQLMHAALFYINSIFKTLCLVLSNHASLGLVFRKELLLKLLRLLLEP